MAQYLQLKSGLAVPDSLLYAEPLRAGRPELREIATTRDGRDITRGYVSPFELLQPQDSVLRARGQGNYEIYREVLRDDQVKATFEQRRLAVVSRETEVLPGGDRRQDKQAAEFIEEQLRRIRWDSVTDKMLYGVFYGFAVAECLFARDGAHVVLDAIKVRDRRRFGFDGDGGLRLLTMSQPNPGEALPPRKFWHFATGADHDDEPYGLGLAHWLYWPVFFKRGGMKFWLIFLEKFGAPTTKGTYPANATPEEKSRLLAALEAVTTDSGVIIPEGMAIELLEAARSGSVDYRTLQDKMDAAIAKVVLGQTLTTEASGGQYKADVQMDVRQDLVKADADLVCESFNRTVVRWLCEWNFPNAALPRVWRRIEDDPDLKPQAERDKLIFDMGFRPTLTYVTETYGGEWTERATLGAPPTDADLDPDAAFAEGDDSRVIVDDQIDRLETEAQAALDDMIGQVRALVEQAASLEELRDKLVDIYPALDAQAFARVMQRALAAATLAGRYDILEQVRGG